MLNIINSDIKLYVKTLVVSNPVLENLSHNFTAPSLNFKLVEYIKTKIWCQQITWNTKYPLALDHTIMDVLDLSISKDKKWSHQDKNYLTKIFHFFH